MKIEIRDDIIVTLSEISDDVELQINEVLEFFATLLKVEANCKDFKDLEIEGKYGKFRLKCLSSVNHFAIMKIEKEE